MKLITLLDQFGDTSAKISKTEFSGIIEITTSLEISQVVDNIREKISEEPWLIRFCSRIIPIQKECKSNLESIKEEVGRMITCIEKHESYRITIEKRNSQLKSKRCNLTSSRFNSKQSIFGKSRLGNYNSNTW